LTSGGHGSRFPTFWIKKGLYSLPDWGKCQKADWKGGVEAVREAGRGKDSPAMRIMFFTWLTLIAAGLVFYTVIGLSHH